MVRAGAGQRVAEPAKLQPLVAKVEQAIPLPDEPGQLGKPGEAGGVAWDGTAFWVADPGYHRLRHWDPHAGATSQPGEVQVGFKPGPLAWDPEKHVLWVVNAGGEPPIGGSRSWSRSKERQIIGIPLRRGDRGVRVSGKILTVPIPSEADPLPVTGLAWDGEKLWMCTAGGLCSCVYRIDQDKDGEVLLSFFPRCEPVGLAIDHAGKRLRLWLAAERPAGRDPLVLQRAVVLPEGRTGKAPYVAYQVQRFVSLPAGQGLARVRPRGLAIREGALWVLDAQGPGSNRLVRYGLE